ncbi:major histocompatibility complex class I-related gene protein-like [Scomber japonicus]|uniref:major histocompatibility complex class I-related gene protein-like n=1 Tax=Scomber japonicus TaxID=13676 RepID=UPI002304F85F|nr:major histocompatibility complex class I-related gene protein-like [Scomber japonicus]
MKILFLLLHFFYVVSPITHSLRFFLTGSSGVSNFPAFVSVAMVDDVEVIYCDSNNQTAEAKHDWMKKLMEDTKPLDSTAECLENQRFFNDTIRIWMQRFNHSGGVHTLQRMYGCEWDDETQEVNGFNQYGYDGEDFIVFDLKTLTWIAPIQQAETTKQKWESNRALVVQTKHYLSQICVDWLKKYLYYGRSSLMRKDLPSVSLLQKTPSSPVRCHATGFYPDRADIFWRKDGEELHENVELGEILPNHDGSFQMSVDLNLSSVTPEDWRRYECVFQLSGVKDDIITKLDKAVIKSNWVPPSEFPAGPVIGGVVGLLLLAVCITGVFIWRRRNYGEGQQYSSSHFNFTVLTYFSTYSE